MPRIISVYRSSSKPAEVAGWEGQVEGAETDTAALVQLVYHLLLQVRTIKLVLMWALVVVPVVAVIVVLVLLGSGAMQ